MINAMPNPMQPHEHLLPFSIHVTPSDINAWREGRRPDQRYTDRQLFEMQVEGLDPQTCDFVVVRSAVSVREMWWPSTSPKPVYLCPSPILRRLAPDKLLVISPAGMRKWVYADGSITRAKPSKWSKRA